MQKKTVDGLLLLLQVMTHGRCLSAVLPLPYFLQDSAFTLWSFVRRASFKPDCPHPKGTVLERESLPYLAVLLLQRERLDKPVNTMLLKGLLRMLR